MSNARSLLVRRLLFLTVALSIAVLSAPAAAEEVGFWESIRTPDTKPVIVDERFEPIALIRTIFSYTMDDELTYQVVQGGDTVDRTISAKKASESRLGYRRGFTLDTVEFGIKGRFDGPGIYYKVKITPVPREKDGEKSDDYLKDAYVGWNPYRIFDLRVGRMKMPFSQANLKHTGHMWLIYKPTLDLLSPKRLLGAQLAVGDPWGIARLKGAVFNSVKYAHQQMKSFDQLLYSGRFELDIAKALEVGGVGLDDFEFKFGASVAYTELDYDNDKEHLWWGVDARVRYWVFGIEAEYLAKNFYGDSSMPNPNNPSELVEFELAKRGWGWHIDFQVRDPWWDRLALSFRFEQMEGDDKVVHGASDSLETGDRAKQKKQWFTVGLSVFLDKHARVDLNYVYRDWLEGHQLRDDMIMAMFQYDL